MPKLNAQAFSVFTGISRPTVYTYIKKGRLIRDEERLLDTNHPINLEFISMRLNKLRGQGPVLTSGDFEEDVAASQEDRRGTCEQSQPKKPTVLPPSENGSNSNENDVDSDELDALSHTALEKIKLAEAIREKRIKNGEARGDLIDKTIIKRIFAKLYVIDSSEFKTMSQTLAPDIAGACGVDSPETIVKIAEIIENNVFSTLSHIKRVLNDFLKEIGETEIEEVES